MSLRVGCGIDYVTGLCYKDSILAHGGASSRDDPEGRAGSGVLRPRLVTAGSGGPGHRPPGTTTWLRGASLYGSGGNAGDGSAAPDRKSPRWSNFRSSVEPYTLPWRANNSLGYIVTSPWRSTAFHVNALRSSGYFGGHSETAPDAEAAQRQAGN